MRRGTALLFAVLVASLGACQAPLTRESIAALDYGPRPDDYEKIVRDYLQPRLVEPVYARIELKTEPKPLYQKEALALARDHGWAVCAMITDKDRRGAYEPPYPMVFYIRDGKVAATNGNGLERAAGVRYAEAQCRELGYEIQ